MESECHTSMRTRVQSPESILKKIQAWCFTLANPNTEETRTWDSLGISSQSTQPYLTPHPTPATYTQQWAIWANSVSSVVQDMNTSLVEMQPHQK